MFHIIWFSYKVEDVVSIFNLNNPSALQICSKY